MYSRCASGTELGDWSVVLYSRGFALYAAFWLLLTIKQRVHKYLVVSIHSTYHHRHGVCTCYFFDVTFTQNVIIQNCTKTITNY